MRASKIGCLLVLSGAAVMLNCGGSTAYTKKGPEKPGNTVTINNCNADPDTIAVHKGDVVTWNVDPLESPKHTYSVSFSGRKPIASSTAPTGQGQNITSDFWCNNGNWIYEKWCVYGYNLIQTDVSPPKTCPDPGVHIIPGGP
jgi:plastocyanin